jgi:hypothetical protein
MRLNAEPRIRDMQQQKHLIEGFGWEESAASPSKLKAHHAREGKRN